MQLFIVGVSRHKKYFFECVVSSLNLLRPEMSSEMIPGIKFFVFQVYHPINLLDVFSFLFLSNAQTMHEFD